MLKFVIIAVIVIVIVLASSDKSSLLSSPPPSQNTNKNKNVNQNNYTRTAQTDPCPQRSSSADNTRTVTRQNFTQKLDSLTDTQDVKVQSSDVQKRLVKETRSYTTRKRRTYNSTKETINVDLGWSENLAELLEATEVVYTNAQMNCERRLVSECFDYYINLHYRSFTAADLCHAKYEEMQPYYDQIKKIVNRLRDRNDPLRVDKEAYNQLVQPHNTMNSICALLKERVSTLNRQTKTLKDKIRDECGRRGQAWYDRLTERVGQNSSN